MDFLSALTFYHTQQAKTPVIVLNSLSLKARAVEKIRNMSVGKVYLYLDRDDSGNRIKAHFTKQLNPDVTLIDKSDLYSGYKDFNEFLVSTTAKHSPISSTQDSPIFFFQVAKFFTVKYKQPAKFPLILVLISPLCFHRNSDLAMKTNPNGNQNKNGFLTTLSFTLNFAKCRR